MSIGRGLVRATRMGRADSQPLEVVVPTVPPVVLFDVNETLSDMSGLRTRFTDVGAPAHLSALWFATVLRDGFALTAAGGQERFAVLAEHALQTVLADVDLDRDLDAAVAYVMSGFAELDVHPDVVDGVRRLRATGARLATLTNGGTAVADALLTRAGIRADFESLLTVEDAGTWKPAPGSYAYAASTLGVQPGQIMLVAVHPWDTDGAARAGLRTAWVNRTGSTFAPFFKRPEITVPSLPRLADALDGTQ